MPLAGRPLIEWSLDALRGSEAVSAIVVAAPPGFEHRLGGEEAAGGAGGPVLTVVNGGATRAESVANALAVGAGTAAETELVAIHDAARPLLTAQLVAELVARLDADPDAAGVIAAAPITDTVKSAGSKRAFSPQQGGKAQLEVERTLDRAQLWAAQTPQVFRNDALRAALAVDEDVRNAATDEAMLVEAAGGRVLIHPTPAANLKVTTPLDLRVAELLLRDR